MEFPLSISSGVEKIKKTIFSSDFDLYSFISPSAYDTAWLAMIHDPKNPSQPMFNNYLEWLLNNQKPEGFWGETDTFGKPTVESLPSTLVSMVVLKKWNTGASMIHKGLLFINANAETLLSEVKDDCPCWLAIVLPAMIKLADTMGLDVVFPESSTQTLSYIHTCHKTFLYREDPRILLSYLEALPSSYVSQKEICSNLSEDGSLFQTPSATAKAFMDFGNQECLTYLRSLAQKCTKSVPQAYPMDEDHIKLSIANQLQKLGVGEYFTREIQVLLAQVYGNYKEEMSGVKTSNNNIIINASQLHKDALAFELLRTHGFKVSPSKFCWFVEEDGVRGEVEKEYKEFSSAMLHVYRASNLMFIGESEEVEEARSFSRKLLHKVIQTGNPAAPGLRRQMEHELNLPWFARMDHLEHRMWIEEKEGNALWKGKKTSYIRVSDLYNHELLQLATLNFEFKQLLYKNELAELKRWTEKCGISNMGFGREKTTFCYFAVAAACTSLPHDSYVRIFVAKCAILITVVDDFFDMKGSLNQLQILTDAVQRWDSIGLSCSSHSKVIFDAIDSLVSEATTKYFQQQGTTTNDDISGSLKDLWYEVFQSWLIEATWSRNGHKPSIDCYLKTGMTSIAAHALVLPASCFLKPTLPTNKLRPIQYEPITKLLMIISRLLNDTESYQKEKEEGKLNSVLVNLIDNPELDIEDSIAFVREIVEKKKKEFIELALIDGLCDLPKPTKQLHLSCLKVFQMFFNSSNKFDSNTELLEDINKAIYFPLSRTRTRTTRINSISPQPFTKNKYTTAKLQISFSIKHNSSRINFSGHRVSALTVKKEYQMASKIGLGFI